MQTPPKTGTVHTKTVPVKDKHAVDFAIPELPPVLSTPSLVLFLEQTCRELMQPYLQQGELTVGVMIELEHLAPAPIGVVVACTSRVVQCDGPLVTFQIEARDDVDLLARGLHKRRVVNAARLGARVREKLAATSEPKQPQDAAGISA